MDLDGAPKPHAVLTLCSQEPCRDSHVCAVIADERERYHRQISCSLLILLSRQSCWTAPARSFLQPKDSRQLAWGTTLGTSMHSQQLCQDVMVEIHFQAVCDFLLE